jgi:hypothetical protein
VGHAVLAVALHHVADDLVAPVVGEVDVHIRHGDPLGVQESLEEEPVADGVHVGDGEAVRDERARRGAAPGAHRDPLPAREGDEVPHHQEVAGEPHGGDDTQLVAKPLEHGVGGSGAVAGAEALQGQMLEIGVQGEAGGDLVVRQVELAEGHVEGTALRHRQRVPVGIGQLAKHLPHLVRRLEIELLGGELPAVGVAHGGAGLDAEQRLVGAGMPGLEVM